MKKMKNLILSVSLLILFSGCTTYKCTFPTEINSVAHGCKNDAQAKIQSVSSSLKMKSDCSVTEMPGDRNYSGMWCWYDPTWKMYVGGLCNGNGQIWIGCNPNNRADIHVPSLTHEMGHYWLMTNFGDFTHNPKYDRLFDNWQHAREVTGSGFWTTNSVNDAIKKQSEVAGYGKPFSVNYIDKFGVETHVDLIKLDK
jgi:hypothetical protein